MSETTARILFMDDEPYSDVVIQALARLRGCGFIVDFVESLGEAIEAYYSRYYDVFILDIDMSHQSVDEDGDGVEVLKLFVSLHNQTKVILFSGAGTVPHWFQAASAHCYAYIHKLDDDPETGAHSIDRLVDVVQAALATRPVPTSPARVAPPSKALLVGDDTELFSTARTAIAEVLGADWAIEECSLNTALDADPAAQGVIVVAQRKFEMRASVRDVLARLLAVVPRPQTIVCCEGRDDLRPSTLFIANHHPFRMLDVTNPQWMAQLRKALEDAHIWYAQQEIQKADPDAIRRVHIVLPEDLGEATRAALEEMEWDIRDDVDR